MDFRDLAVPARAVLKYAGGEDYKALKMACGRLSECILERQADDSGEILHYALFSAIRYENGTIFVKFHSDLKPFFLGVTSNFMKYDLQEFLKLPSIYSQSGLLSRK
jgi:plasmid replication initiation protein